MKKLLKPGDVLLLGLAGAMDVFEDVKGAFGAMARGSDMLYGWVPERYRKHNFSRVVARQLITGDIEKVIKGDQVYIRLTSAGREKIARDFPMFSLSQKPWDRQWRVVIFDISEINKSVRNSLRNKLQELGFGMLQESVWVTPHDVSIDLREFLESHNLGDIAFVLEVSSVLAGDIDALVKKIWKLDSLAEEYQEIITGAIEAQDVYVTLCGRTAQHTSKRGGEVNDVKKKKNVGNMGDLGASDVGKKGDIGKKVREIRERYVAAVLSDPCLPKELLPKDWPGREARKAVEKLKHFV